MWVSKRRTFYKLYSSNMSGQTSWRDVGSEGENGEGETRRGVSCVAVGRGRGVWAGGGAVSCNVERAHDHVCRLGDCEEDAALCGAWGVHHLIMCETLRDSGRRQGVPQSHATTTRSNVTRGRSAMRSAQRSADRRAAARGGPGRHGGITLVSELVVVHIHDFTDREQAWCTLCTP